MSLVVPTLNEEPGKPMVKLENYIKDVAINQTPIQITTPSQRSANPHIPIVGNELQQIVNQQVKKITFKNKENNKSPSTSNINFLSDIPKPPTIGSSRIIKTPNYYSAFPLSSSLQFINRNLNKNIRDALDYWQIDERTKPFVLDSMYRRYLKHGYKNNKAEREYKIASDYLNSIQ
jgi:hypothetical protein